MPIATGGLFYSTIMCNDRRRAGMTWFAPGVLYNERIASANAAWTELPLLGTSVTTSPLRRHKRRTCDYTFFFLNYLNLWLYFYLLIYEMKDELESAEFKKE